jgi:apolipoprotein N-acyltransferase
MKQDLVTRVTESVILALLFTLAFRFPVNSGKGYLEAVAAFLFITILFAIVITKRHLGWIYTAITLGFIIMLYWVPKTIAIKGPLPYSLALFASGLLCCWEALCLLAVVVCGRWAYLRGGHSSAACIAATVMSLSEMYGFHVYHWSWGATLGGVPWMAKSAAFLGTHGLTALMWSCGVWTGTHIVTNGGYKKILCGPLCFITVLITCAGLWRTLPRGPQLFLNVVIIQPNFAPGIHNIHMEQDMWQRSDAQLKLSGWPITDIATLLIWPESSVLGRDDRQPSVRMQLEAQSRKIAWLFGTEGGDFNLVRGEVAGRSSFIQAKVEPMPFGERTPGPNILRKWLDNHTGFISQLPGILNQESSFQIPTPQGSIKVHPIICSEATISSRVQAGITIAGGDLLTNHTNDGWFERNPTSDLHAAEIRLRAVETGLPLIRATLTGRSGIFREDGSWILWDQPMTEAHYEFQLCWRPIVTPARNSHLIKIIMLVLTSIGLGLCLLTTINKNSYIDPD